MEPTETRTLLQFISAHKDPHDPLLSRKPGDVVIVKDDSIPNMLWKLCGIMEIIIVRETIDQS